MHKDISLRVIVDHVSKSFDLDASKRSILSRINAIFQKVNTKKHIEAARDISFTVRGGEVLGLIGRNGVGKSTMLRLVAGIMLPDSGRISTSGSLIYISGFNHVIKPRLSMRENIFFAGSLLGLTNTEIRAKFDEIVDFGGLREFLDAKVFQFSSGMIARLNFSILIHCASAKAPDILILDEVMHAGGDMDFDAKASEKMKSFIRNGAAVIMASHNMQDIEKYCDRAIWMEDGVVKKDGTPGDVISSYRGSVSYRS